MLGRAGVATPGGGARSAAEQGSTPPTFRVPGASIAARAGASGIARESQAGGGPRQAGVAGGQGRGHGAPAPANGRSTADAAHEGRPLGDGEGADATDDEGFQPVRRRGWRRAQGAGESNTGTQADTAGRARQDRGGDDDAHVEGAADACDDGPPTPRTLRREWLDEVAIVRRLKGQGLAGDHPAMQAACAARDAAEATWREAKEPVPTAVRLARAQARLDRAIEVQGEAYRALCEYEREHAEKVAVLRSRVEEERERVRARRQQLAAVQAEVGAEGMGARVQTRQGAAVQQVHTAISGTVAPTIAALVEQLDSSTPAWGVLNGLLGTLADSQSALEKALAQGPVAQSFDIAGGDDGVGAGGVDEDDDDHGEESEWSESHELGEEDAAAQHKGAGTHASGGDGARSARTVAAEEGQPMDTEDWWWGTSHADWQGGSRWQACGHGKWSKSSWADAYEQGGDEESGEGDPPPAARRRLEPVPAAGAGGGGAAAAGDATDEGQRRRQHEGRIQRVVAAAIDAGVQPLTSAGEELLQLDARQLEEWIATHFPAGASVQ